MTEQRERRYIVDYCRTKFPNATIFYNFKLGGVPSSLHRDPNVAENPNIAMPWARYVDACVILPDKMLLIEAKLPAKLEAVAQLMLYRQLVPKTPQLSQYLNRVLELRIVTARPDPELVRFANEQGIQVEIYQPDYAMEYLAVLLRGPVS